MTCNCAPKSHHFTSQYLITSYRLLIHILCIQTLAVPLPVLSGGCVVNMSCLHAFHRALRPIGHTCCVKTCSMITMSLWQWFTFVKHSFNNDLTRHQETHSNITTYVKLTPCKGIPAKSIKAAKNNSAHWIIPQPIRWQEYQRSDMLQLGKRWSNTCGTSAMPTHVVLCVVHVGNQDLTPCASFPGEWIR